ERDHHRRPEAPGLDRDPALAQELDEAVEPAPPLVGRRGAEEVGTPPALQVREQRELGDGEHRAADLGEREVHLPLRVLEDAQLVDAAREVGGLPLAVAVRHPEQHDEAARDAADATAVDGDLAAPHALDDGDHAALTGPPPASAARGRSPRPTPPAPPAARAACAA